MSPLALLPNPRQWVAPSWLWVRCTCAPNPASRRCNAVCFSHSSRESLLVRQRRRMRVDQDHLGLLFSKWEVAVIVLSRRVSGKLLILLHASLQVALAIKRGLNGSLELNSQTFYTPRENIAGKKAGGDQTQPTSLGAGEGRLQMRKNTCPSLALSSWHRQASLPGINWRLSVSLLLGHLPPRGSTAAQKP